MNAVGMPEDWCIGSMEVNVSETGDLTGTGSCAWDLTATVFFLYGAGTIGIAVEGTLDEDGLMADGELTVSSDDYGPFFGTGTGEHTAERTDLTMQFEWSYSQTVTFTRE